MRYGPSVCSTARSNVARSMAQLRYAGRPPDAKRKRGAGSALAVHGLDQRLNIPEGERERLVPVRVALDGRRVVRHEHAVVANFLVDAQRLEHVHVAVVGERLLEVEEA